jgi:hypothetical protein
MLAAGCSPPAMVRDEDPGSDPQDEQATDSMTGGEDVAPDEDASSGSADDAQTDDTTSDDASSDGASSDGASPECGTEGGPDACVVTCTDAGVTCMVEDPGFTCEFLEFAGWSATVACGQAAAVGIACCGGCGCVAVDVYYDGRQCWEGIPGCSRGPVAQFAGQWLVPHAPAP